MADSAYVVCYFQNLPLHQGADKVSLRMLYRNLHWQTNNKYIIF